MVESELEWTGERLVTSIFSHGAIDHLHRYAIATELVKDKVVLDIASGEGYGSHLLSFFSKKVIGVDISSEAISHASIKYRTDNLEFRQGSADKIPVSENSIDVVVSFETIEHHDRHEEMLSEIKRVLKPNGVLVISSPDKLNYSDVPKYTNPFHVKELYRNDFMNLMKKFFAYTTFFNQKSVVGSLIIPDLPEFSFSEFAGNYSEVQSFEGFHEPIYNLCIASDSPTPYFKGSFFKGKNPSEVAGAIARLQKEVNSLKNELVLVRRLRLNLVVDFARWIKKLLPLSKK